MMRIVTIMSLVLVVTAGAYGEATTVDYICRDPRNVPYEYEVWLDLSGSEEEALVKKFTGGGSWQTWQTFPQIFPMSAGAIGSGWSTGFVQLNDGGEVGVYFNESIRVALLVVNQKQYNYSCVSTKELAFLRAAPGADLQVITSYLAAGGNPNAKTSQGTTALIKASQVGNNAAVELLLSYGAEVDWRDAVGLTPLWAATISAAHLIDEGGDYSRYRQLMATLLQHGAQPDLPSGRLSSAIHFFGTFPGVAGKYYAPPSTTPLMWASRFGTHDIVDALLAAKADANLRDSEGNTALIYAVVPIATKGCQVDIVKSLLAAGANPHVLNHDRDTAWTYAQRTGEYANDDGLKQNCGEVVRLLKEQGADIWQRPSAMLN